MNDQSPKSDKATPRKSLEAQPTSGLDVRIGERKDSRDRSGQKAPTGGSSEKVQRDESQSEKKGTQPFSLGDQLRHHKPSKPGDGPRGLEKLKQTLAQREAQSGSGDVPAESKLGRMKTIMEQIRAAPGDSTVGKPVDKAPPMRRPTDDSSRPPRGPERTKQTDAQSRVKQPADAVEPVADRRKTDIEKKAAQVEGAKDSANTRPSKIAEAGTAQQNREQVLNPKDQREAPPASDPSTLKDGGSGDKRDNREVRVHGPGLEGYSTGKDTLSLDQFKKLEEAATPKDGTPLYGNDKLTMVIEATASRLGSTESNLQLTERRAKNVQKEFIDRGFTGIFIMEVMGEGGSKDTDPHSQSDNPQDRVVRVSVSVDEESKEQKKTEVNPNSAATDVADVIQPLPKQEDNSLLGQAKREGKRGIEAWKETAPIRKAADAFVPGLGEALGPLLAAQDYVLRHYAENIRDAKIDREKIPAVTSSAINRLEHLAGVPYPHELLAPASDPEVLRVRELVDRYWHSLPKPDQEALGKAIRTHTREFEIALNSRLLKNFGR